MHRLALLKVELKSESNNEIAQMRALSSGRGHFLVSSVMCGKLNIDLLTLASRN